MTLLECPVESTRSCSLLRYEDVMELMPPAPPGLDEETEAALFDFKKRIYEHRVSQVNSNLDRFSQRSPDGSPIMFFVGMELCSDNIDLVLQRFCDPDFIQQINKEIHDRSHRKIPIQARNAEKIVEETYEKDISSTSMRRHSATWSHDEIKLFMEIVSGDSADSIDWSVVSDIFPGKTRGQCRELYNKLQKREGMQTRSPRRSTRSPSRRKGRGESDGAKQLTSIVFTFKEDTFRMGQISIQETYALLNPFPGCIDQITTEPMTVPAMSPDGFVLDYSTWMKIITSGNKVNPFTREKIKSKRDLVILTIDNIVEYRNKIVNLESCVLDS